MHRSYTLLPQGHLGAKQTPCLMHWSTLYVNVELRGFASRTDIWQIRSLIHMGKKQISLAFH